MQLLRLFLFIMMFFCADVMAMDISSVKDDLLATMLSKYSLVFDHDTICALALVNKHHHLLIMDGVPERKKFLIQYDVDNFKNVGLLCLHSTSAKLFHRYGTSYAMAAVEGGNSGPKILMLFHRFLVGNRDMSTRGLNFNYKVFSSLLDQQMAPFFNENGVLSLYGYGPMEIGRKWKTGLMRYEISEETSSSWFPCYFRVKNKSNEIIWERPITKVMKTPLLKTFLEQNPYGLNSLPAKREQIKRYSYFGESAEDVVVIEMIKEK